MREAVRYEFPPPEHHHVLGPYTAGQLAATLGALAVAVFGIVRPDPTLPRIALAAGVVVAVVVPVAIPWRGRTATEWLPIATAYGAGRLTGRTDFRTTAPWQATSSAGSLRAP